MNSKVLALHWSLYELTCLFTSTSFSITQESGFARTTVWTQSVLAISVSVTNRDRGIAFVSIYRYRDQSLFYQSQQISMEKDGCFRRFHASILLLTQFIGFEILCRTVQERPASPRFWTAQPANIVLFASWLLSFNSIRFNCYTSFAIHYHVSFPFLFL